MSENNVYNAHTCMQESAGARVSDSQNSLAVPARNRVYIKIILNAVITEGPS